MLKFLGSNLRETKKLEVSKYTPSNSGIDQRPATVIPATIKRVNFNNVSIYHEIFLSPNSIWFRTFHSNSTLTFNRCKCLIGMKTAACTFIFDEVIENCFALFCDF